MKLDITDVQWQGVRFLDRNFRTFFYDGSYYKALLPTAEAWMEPAFLEGFFNTLHDRGFIPRMEKADIRMDGFLEIYKQETDFFSIYLSSFPPDMLKDAALLYLDLCSWLHDNNVSLIDGHAGNFIIQKNAQIRWCDVGSFSVFDQAVTVDSLRQFFYNILGPLFIREKFPHSGDLVRHFAYHNDLKAAAAAEMFGIRIDFYDSMDLKESLSQLREMIQALQFQFTPTTWSNYYTPVENEDVLDYESNRVKIFDNIIKDLRPKHIIDIGANTGFFSRRAAVNGAEVLSLDADEAAVNKHYVYIKQNGYSGNVKPALASFSSLPPGRGKVGDLAIALALTHHLFLSQHYNWAVIAEYLAAHTTKNLLTEFMPNGLSMTEEPKWLPHNYSLDNFQRQLLRFFEKVRPITYDNQSNSPRIFLLCLKKREHPLDADKPSFYFGLTD